MSRYFTTPIYYVNDRPHIGHLYTTLVTDTLTRFYRLQGEDVRFLTGTDEHGQKIAKVAKKEGVAPIDVADRHAPTFRDLWKRFGVANDDFIRTTEPRHRIGVTELIRRLEAAGDLYVAGHEGWYCVGCEAFYPEKDLEDGKCPTHGTAPEWQKEENVFFRLSKYQDRLLELYENGSVPGIPFVFPETRLNEVRSFVSAGLKDLSVSRTAIEWGIPFPGHPGHVVYVWLDALTNYLTALGFGSGDESGAKPRTALLAVRRRAPRHPPRRQGHPPLPRRLLARVPDVGGASPPDAGRQPRLLAEGPAEDVEVGRQRRPPRRPRGRLRGRRPPLAPHLRDELRAGRLLLRRGVPRPLQQRPRERPRQHPLARREDGVRRLRRDDALRALRRQRGEARRRGRRGDVGRRLPRPTAFTKPPRRSARSSAPSTATSPRRSRGRR